MQGILHFKVQTQYTVLNFTAFIREWAKDMRNYETDQEYYISGISSVFVTPWITAHQASLSITNSQGLLKFMSMESVMPSSHLMLCHPLLLLPQSLPAWGLFQWVNSSHEVAKVLEFQLQHQSFQWKPRISFRWAGWISLQSKGLWRVFSNTTVQKHQFFGTQLSSQSNSHIHTLPLEKPYPWLDGPLLAK